jgi:hypothetical protein
MADQVAGELERYYQASGEPAEGELVFPSPKSGGPLDKSAALRRMRRALKAARLDEGHRFHDYADVRVMPMSGRKSLRIGLIAA